MEIKGECPLSIRLKQKRHVKSSHCFFQVKGKLIFLFQYKQKFTHWFWKYKPRKDNFTSAGASLAVLSLFKNLWTYASCCPLTFFFFFFSIASPLLCCVFLTEPVPCLPSFLQIQTSSAIITELQPLKATPKEWSAQPPGEPADRKQWRGNYLFLFQWSCIHF